MRFGLDRVNEIGKLHRVLDKEHRDVVADQVPVALLRIELGREAAHVPHRVCTAALAGDRREADEHRLVNPTLEDAYLYYISANKQSAQT